MMENCLSKRSTKFPEDDDDYSEGVVRQEPTKTTSRRRTTRNESEKRRRDKLNVYITELAGMVPLCASSQKKFDKTTVLKMTVNYMRVHNDLTTSVLGKDSGLQASFLSSDEVGEIMDESLNGFLFVLSKTGAVTFASKSITSLFGYKLEDIIGSNFLDLIHPDDRSGVLNELSEDSPSVILHTDMNDFQPSNGRLPRKHTFNVRLKSGDDELGDYFPIHLCGFTNCWDNGSTESMQPDHLKALEGSSDDLPSFQSEPHYLVAVGLLSVPSYERHVSLSDNSQLEFSSRHAMDGKFLFVDPRSIKITGFWPSEVLGTSIYTYIHLDDLQMLAALHESMLEYGESKSGPYRMRCKDTHWVWLKSRSYVSYNHWNSKPEFFCSTNVVVSPKEGVEGLKERQVPPRQMQPYSEFMSQASASSAAAPIDPQESNLMLMTAWANDNSDSLSASLTEVQELSDTESCLGAISTSGKELVVFSKTASSETSVERSHNGDSFLSSKDDDEDDSDSSSSMDLSMSYEELESFIEAQRQLHDQLYQKHSVLENAIVKQRQQLQDIQQQMLLNLQAQLTLDPGKNHEVFESQLKMAKEITDRHEKQATARKEFARRLSQRKRKTEKRNQQQLKLFFQNRQNNGPDSGTPSSTSGVGVGVESQTSTPQVSTPQISTANGQQSRYSATLEVEEQQPFPTPPPMKKPKGNRLQPRVQPPPPPPPMGFTNEQELQVERYQSRMGQQGVDWQQRQQQDANKSSYYEQRKQQVGSGVQRQSAATCNTARPPVSAPQMLGANNLQQQQHQQQQQQLHQQRQQQHLMQQRQQELQLQQQRDFANAQQQQTREQFLRPSLNQQHVIPQTLRSPQTPSAFGMLSPLQSPTEPTNQPTPFVSAPEEQPNTLQNIQDLLTISSQNPKAMQMLLSGLGSQPEVAQTLLNLLKQAQNPNRNDGGSLAYNMQQTTSQFSAVLSSNNVGLNTRPFETPQPQHSFSSLEGIEVGQRITHETLRGKNLAFNRQTESAAASASVQMQNIANQDQRNLWSSTDGNSPMNTRHLGLLHSFTSPPGVAPQENPPPLRGITNLNTNSAGKHKDKKDYFSNFSSQELEAMFLTPELPSSSVAQSGANANPEKTKLDDDHLLHSPLLQQQQQLLQMHEDQRKQVLLRQQQEQFYMLQGKGQKTDPQTSQDRIPQGLAPPLPHTQTQLLPVVDPLASEVTGHTLHSLLIDQPSTSATESSGEGPSSASADAPSTSWGTPPPPGGTFELNDADEQVLSLLLAESSMDPLFESSLWLDDDGLSGYLNLNPDLNPD